MLVFLRVRAYVGIFLSGHIYLIVRHDLRKARLVVVNVEKLLGCMTAPASHLIVQVKQQRPSDGPEPAVCFVQSFQTEGMHGFPSHPDKVHLVQASVGVFHVQRPTAKKRRGGP